MIGVYFAITVAVVALVTAFIAQWAWPQRRTRIIFVSAASPALLPIVAAFIISLFDETRIDTDLNWFQQSVNVLLVCMMMMFVGLIGAILGTELASLIGWLRRRRG